MIYNENGIILNEQYNLDYINEGLGDIVNKVSRGVVKVLRAIMDGIANFIDVLQSKKYNKLINTIVKNKGYFTRFKIKDSSLNSIINSRYFESENDFSRACTELKNNNDLSLEELQKILYDGNIDNREEWFYSKNNNGTLECDLEFFINTAASNNKCIKLFRKAYSEIKVINSTITKKPIKSEVVNELYYYFKNAIRWHKKYTQCLIKILKNNKYQLIKDDIITNDSFEEYEAVEELFDEITNNEEAEVIIAEEP